MKRFCAVLMTLTLLFALTACDTIDEVPEVTSFQPPAPEVPGVVTNVDELLAAIKPGAQIILGEGEFCLNKASDYGGQGGDYYHWVSLGMNEYELQIQYVSDLTIRGAGKGKTTLVTEPRFANVLTLSNCHDINLENMTLGHREMTEACEGGVIRLEAAKDVSLENLGLFGCGTVGLQAFESQQLTLEDCEIYNCSSAGVMIGSCQDVEIEESSFHSLGKELPVMHVFGIWDSEKVEISDCRIYDNYVQNLASISGERHLVLEDNRFSENRVAAAAFDFQTEGIILDSNIFEGDVPRNWYAANGYPGLDWRGNPVFFEEPEPEPFPVTPGVPMPVATGEQREVKVKNVEQFLQAIGPDTCIILDSKLMFLSKSKGYKEAMDYFETNGMYDAEYQEEDRPYYKWVNNYDGPSLVISGVSNMTIRAEGKDRSAHTISAVPRYADVLTFENCSAITLSGFTAGHTIEEGVCTGGVFLLENSQDILIENCGMYGCGTEGVCGMYSQNIQVVNSEIYECSYTGIELTQCDNVAISGTLIRDIRNDWEGDAPFFRFYDSRNVTLDGFPLDGNYVGR